MNIGILDVMQMLFGPVVRLVTYVVNNFPPPPGRWMDVFPRVGKARHRVWILQTWLPYLRGERPYWTEALGTPGLDFRVLLLDPNLAWTRTMCRGGISDLIAQNVKDIWVIHKQAQQDHANPARFSGRFYSCIPFGPIYLIDNDAYWGIYRSDDDSMDGPVFRARLATNLGRQIERSYLAIWNRFDSRTGDLALPDAVQGSPTPPLDARIKNMHSALVPFGEDDIRKCAAQGGVLVVIRHAQTDLNDANIFAGNLDVPINAQGQAAARDKSTRVDGVNWHRILRSPLRRTLQTLDQLLQPGRMLQIEVDEVLRERRMGDVEGLHKERYEMSEPKYAGKGLTSSMFAKAHGGGESYADVANRVAPLLESLILQVSAGNNVLVCSHEGPMRMIDMALRALPELEAVTARISNCDMLCYRR